MSKWGRIHWWQCSQHYRKCKMNNYSRTGHKQWTAYKARRLSHSDHIQMRPCTKYRHCCFGNMCCSSHPHIFHMCSWLTLLPLQCIVSRRYCWDRGYSWSHCTAHSTHPLVCSWPCSWYRWWCWCSQCSWGRCREHIYSYRALQSLVRNPCTSLRCPDSTHNWQAHMVCTRNSWRPPRSLTCTPRTCCSQAHKKCNSL